VTRTLHIIKSAGAVHPWDLLAQQTAPAQSSSVVLIQDAVTAQRSGPFPIFALARDVRTRGADTPYPVIDDDRFLEMIWEADSVVVW
jgi:hypothetical protein